MSCALEWTAELERAAERMIAPALEEDRVDNDVTSLAAFSADDHCSATIVVREKAVLAGMRLTGLIYSRLSTGISVRITYHDGTTVDAGTQVASVAGPSRAVLAGERTVLNVLQRLCGIATVTREYVQAVAGTGVAIVDTRKTTPGWRPLEKYAVRCGGGVNHRFDLSEMVMFKDNHIALSGLSIHKLIENARRLYPGIVIACEADTLNQVALLLEHHVDILMLDNMQLEDIRTAVQMNTGTTLLEATGGITLETVRAVAETGVQRVSIGALTHSVRAIDIGMDATPAPNNVPRRWL